jgi:hypothetical protein
MRVYVDMWNLLEYIIMLDVGCWMLGIMKKAEEAFLVEKGYGGCDASVYLLSTPLKISGIN